MGLEMEQATVAEGESYLHSWFQNLLAAARSFGRQKCASAGEVSKPHQSLPVQQEPCLHESTARSEP